MKFNNKELWELFAALNIAAGYSRMSCLEKQAKAFIKLANKIEKELLK